LSEAASKILLLTQENQAADHLISPLVVTNPVLEWRYQANALSENLLASAKESVLRRALVGNHDPLERSLNAAEGNDSYIWGMKWCLVVTSDTSQTDHEHYRIVFEPVRQLFGW
jgi:hypothetical protein